MYTFKGADYYYYDNDFPYAPGIQNRKSTRRSDDGKFKIIYIVFSSAYIKLYKLQKMSERNKFQQHAPCIAFA